MPPGSRTVPRRQRVFCTRCSPRSDHRHAGAGLRVRWRGATQFSHVSSMMPCGSSSPTLVPQTADDGDVFAEWFERLADEREVGLRPTAVGCPRPAARHAGRDEAQSRARAAGVCAQASCRDHGVQQRQRDGRACALRMVRRDRCS